MQANPKLAAALVRHVLAQLQMPASPLDFSTVTTDVDIRIPFTAKPAGLIFFPVKFHIG
jgi:hypothetical protein